MQVSVPWKIQYPLLSSLLTNLTENEVGSEMP